MSSAVLFNAAINNLVDAFFSGIPVYYLSVKFDTIVNELNRNNLLRKNDFKEHPGELVKIVLAFTLTVLVEHGKLADYRHFIGETGSAMGKLCDIANFPDYCLKIGQKEDYASWTHLVLYMISVLRVGKMFDWYGSKSILYDLNLGSVAPTFLSNVILLLYGLLLLRLILVQAHVPGESIRYDVEACTYIVVVSFFYDYNLFTKGLNTVPNVFQWENMKRQIESTQLDPGRYFITLKLGYPLDAYLAQDIIGSAYACVAKRYLDAFKGNIKGALLLTSNPNPYATMTCIHNLRLNSISIVTGRWFRKLVNNSITRGIVKIKRDVTWTANKIWQVATDSYGGLKEAYVFGEEAYNLLYSKSWPKSTGTAALTMGLVAFAGKAWYSFVKTNLKADWKLMTAAVAYAFKKKEMFPERPIGQFQFEPPERPGYLRWDRSPDGKYSAIFNISPLPRATMPPGAPFRYLGQRGGGRTVEAKYLMDLDMLAQAVRRKYVKTEIPVEVAAMIKKKLQFTTTMKGGGLLDGTTTTGQTDFEIAPRLEDEDPLPDGWTSYIIDNAEEPNFFREDEDGETMQLVLIKTPMEKEAIEQAAFVIDSNDDQEKGDEEQLPDPIPDAVEPPSPLTTVTVVKSDAPPPPVDPIVTLPTISPEKKEEIIAATSVPPKAVAEAVVDEVLITGNEPILSRELTEIALSSIPVKRFYSVKQVVPKRKRSSNTRPYNSRKHRRRPKKRSSYGRRRRRSRSSSGRRKKSNRRSRH